MYIEINNLSKKFAEFSLKNINMSIEKGEFIGILGQSGSGKSTILNLIAGLDKNYQGDIFIGGQKPSKVIQAGEIAMVFQQDLLLPHLNVWENIAFGLKIKKLARADIEKRVKEAILDMELTGKEKRFPNELSGGEKQRVSIARAIVTRPKLLLMDEPFSALDFNLRSRMQHLVKKLHQKLKVTIIFVTHDREEAFFLSQKIAVMYQGNLVDYASPENLYYRPKSIYTARLLSIENILPKDVFENIFHSSYEDCNFIGIRGKNLKIVEHSPIEAIIEEVHFKMGEYSFLVSILGEKISVIHQGEMKYAVGDPIFLKFREEDRIFIRE